MQNKLRPPYLSTSFSESGKNAKKRFENILNTNSKKKGTAAFSLFTCLALLCGTLAACSSSLGIIGGADGPTAIYVSESNGSDIVEKLYNSRIKYVGNASGVGKLVGLMDIPDGFKISSDGLMKLQTSSEPYGLTLHYELTDASVLKDNTVDFEQFKKQGTILLCLIENLGSVTYQIKDSDRYKGAVYTNTITREQVNSILGYPLSVCAESLDSFSRMYQALNFTPITTIEDAVSNAILFRNSNNYLDGECTAEGHIILGSENISDQGDIVIYALTTYGNYAFQNGIFVKVAGSGVIPVKITLDNSYTLKDYQEPMDGSLYLDSIKEMFPQKYHSRILHSDYSSDYQTCMEQEKIYAQTYLDSIGRKAEIADHADTVLADMKTEFSNSLLDIFGDYPYWIGTEECIENGTRFVYEKQWQSEKEGSQDGTVTFRKYEYDTNKTVEEYVIRLKGDSMEYLKGTPRPENYSKTIGK